MTAKFIIGSVIYDSFEEIPTEKTEVSHGDA